MNKEKANVGAKLCILWLFSLTVMTEAVDRSRIFTSRDQNLVKSRYRRLNTHRRLQSCQQFIDEVEAEELDAECTCDYSGAPDLFVVDCLYPSCDNDCIEGVCAISSETYTFRIMSGNTVYGVSEYTYCGQFTAGQSGTVCYYSEYDSDGNFASCDVQYNGNSCQSCGECSLDCSNVIQGETQIDLCGAVDVPSSSALLVFDDNFQAECQSDDDNGGGGEGGGGGGNGSDRNGAVSAIVGDPHITTFDGLEFDCHVPGEFVLATSEDFVIQGRFTRANSFIQATVTTGIAIRLNFGQEIVQVSLTPNTGLPCTPNVFINSASITLVDGDTPTSFGFVTVSMVDGEIKLEFSATGLDLRLLVRYSESFGCFLRTVSYIPPELQQGVRGLFGSPNGDQSDDWMTSDGSILTVPENPRSLRFEPAYNYCSNYWCLTDPNDSLFTYSQFPGESFTYYEDCFTVFDGSLENAVDSASSDLIALCGSLDLACLIDGTVGNILDAEVYLNEVSQVLETRNELLGITSTMAPSEIPSTGSPVHSPLHYGKGSGHHRRRRKGKKGMMKGKKGMTKAGKRHGHTRSPGVHKSFYSFSNGNHSPSPIHYDAPVFGKKKQTQGDGDDHHQMVFTFASSAAHDETPPPATHLNTADNKEESPSSDDSDDHGKKEGN